MSDPIVLDKRKIGPNCPVFITFEAGPTHDGLPTAKELVWHAAKAGADAIKFQILDPDRLVADKHQKFSYQILEDRATGKLKTIEEPLYDILCRRTLRREEWIELKKYSDSLGLLFFATVAFDEEVDLLVELNCSSIKIASGDVNHHPLIRRAARTGMCIQLDTGNSTLGEIEEAVDICRREGNEKIVIHQCPSGYPARLESINLNILQTLQGMFPYPVAFSDHTPGRDMDIAAIAMGAHLVEKTITLNRMTPSVEHVMSLEPGEMKEFVESIRALEVAFGSSRRVMDEKEAKKRQSVRRSVHLDEPGKVGQRLSEVAFSYRRPGFGIGPHEISQYEERRLARTIAEGEIVMPSDVV